MPDTQSPTHSAGTITVQQRAAGDRVVVAVSGELDMASAPVLRSAISTALDAGAQHLWVDLCATEFMDSSGIHLLIDTHQRVQDLGRRLAIVCPPGPVRRVFDVVGVADQLPLRHGQQHA